MIASSDFKKPSKSGYNDKEKVNWRSTPTDKNNLKCIQYGQMRHNKENCWDLVGSLKNSTSLTKWANTTSSNGSEANMGYTSQKTVSIDTTPSGEAS